MTLRKALLILGASATLSASALSGSPAEQDKVILHAWSWNLPTIAQNMRQIAEAGYDFVQTSPVQACYVGEDGGLALYSQEGDSIRGKWYYYYQPTDWTIGNYIMGTREDFKALADSAYKYGVRIIVDVLPNHTAIDHNAVLPGLDHAVGGHENLFHANGFKPITQWNDRYECTTGEMGGLPDVNTENPDFQYYFLQYINDLINLGARGFRYDTAKHIGLPSDPLDAKAERNNFWPVATGREGVKGLSLLMPDSLYIYGEVLQDKNVKEDEYAQYMDLTASAYGHTLRDALDKGKLPAEALTDWNHHVAPDRLVTWVESHDTYANAHESAHLTDEQIRVAYAFIAARATGRPLFFSRPAGSTRDNYWGDNVLGARGNDEFFAPDVVAANKFRHDMSGQPEQLAEYNDGAVVTVARGDRGLAVLNFSRQAQRVDIDTTLPDGEYGDLRVKNGKIKTSLAPLAIRFFE